jgi:hypothetical protein
MATPPTFVTGTVLTAAQMNTIGMHLVKTVTIGNNVANVPVTDCFSADYENYKVVISMNNNTAGGGSSMLMQFTGITNNAYYTIGTYAAWASSIFQLIGSVTSSWVIGFPFGTLHNLCVVDVYAPFRNDARTTGKSQMAAPAYASTYQHQVAQNTSTTGFTVIMPSGDNMTGGTIRVYGYRNTL